MKNLLSALVLTLASMGSYAAISDVTVITNKPTASASAAMPSVKDCHRSSSIIDCKRTRPGTSAPSRS